MDESTANLNVDVINFILQNTCGLRRGCFLSGTSSINPKVDFPKGSKKLRELAWSGVFDYMRPTVWRLLLSLVPLGSVEELLAAYDSQSRELPPSVPV
ncbi:hypothetical protein RIF29_16628 [Crotalaria pallida]|uniref:Rab-GAP TBC domain-containing protein n=1 Tax=Crotalaria pallida TaxID=3830 RepID=A0AAN9FH01_CROPI